MKNLVLSIFPGLDLLGRAFESVGYTVVRGPDKLWGGDIKSFHVDAGIFEGVIGGPPCQWASQALFKHGAHGLRSMKHPPVDMTAEFVRVVDEAKPSWVVMENVSTARKSISLPTDWFPIKLRDWDCGGMTSRRRWFWVYPACLVLSPAKRPGKPNYSVLATSWKTRASFIEKHTKGFAGYEYLKMEEAAYLQGYPELAEILKPFGRAMGVHLLGNGVPKAMGEYIAHAVQQTVAPAACVTMG